MEAGDQAAARRLVDRYGAPSMAAMRSRSALLKTSSPGEKGGFALLRAIDERVGVRALASRAPFSRRVMQPKSSRNFCCASRSGTRETHIQDVGDASQGCFFQGHFADWPRTLITPSRWARTRRGAHSLEFGGDLHRVRCPIRDKVPTYEDAYGCTERDRLSRHEGGYGDRVALITGGDGPGRCLSGGAVAEQGLCGPRCQAPLLVLQHRAQLTTSTRIPIKLTDGCSCTMET